MVRISQRVVRKLKWLVQQNIESCGFGLAKCNKDGNLYV